MSKFVFVMQHRPSTEQVEAARATGASRILCLTPTKDEDKVEGIEYGGSVQLLNVPDDPSLRRDWFIHRASEILNAFGGMEATDIFHAMGQPQLANALNAAASRVGAVCVESVTARESVDQQQPDGSTKKVAVFRFKGFRPVYTF